MASRAVLKERAIEEGTLREWAVNLIAEKAWRVMHKGKTTGFQCPSTLHAIALESICDDMFLPCYHVCEGYVTLSGSYTSLYALEERR